MSEKALELYDNTRISACRQCPRFFYFRHVLDLAPENPAPALCFGGSWHRAMDVVWPRMTSLKGTSFQKRWRDVQQEIVEEAMQAFQAEWTSYGFPGLEEVETDTYRQLAPRTPTTAMEMLYAYTDERKTFLTTGDIELLEVELPFVVPLDPANPRLFYCGRLDKVIRREGRIHGIEHKTTTAYRKNGPFRTSFLESFSPNSQIDGYLFAGHSLYGDRFKSIMVDASLVHASETGFRFLAVERMLAQLDAWLWETRYWINQIQANQRAMTRHDQDAPYLAAFPKQTGACISFEQTCTYLDLCKARPDPTTYQDDIPLGFKQERWEPFEELELHKVFDKQRRAK